MERHRRAARVRRAGPAFHPRVQRAREPGQREHVLHTAADPLGRRDRGAGASWQRSAAGALSAQAGERRMVGDDESHRATGRQRLGRAAHRGRPHHGWTARRQIPHRGAEDLYHLGRSRAGVQYRPSGTRAPAQRARGKPRHLAVRGAQIPRQRRRQPRGAKRSAGRQPGA